MAFFTDGEKIRGSRKLSNKLLLSGLMVFTFIFMLNFAYAAEFDNKLTYKDNDLKIELTNWFGLGTDYGTATLKSHKSIDEVISVGLGKQVTMYYDFEFLELYENGLGDVKFINMKNGQSVDKEYKFVYWVNETKTRDVYETVCPIALKGENVTCEQVVVGKEDYVVGSWKDYNVKTIPKGNIRIGIEVDNKEGDFIDGIWTIGGKEVTRHASWTASLNTDLVSYYKLNETSGVVLDSLNVNNGTNNGATRGVTGKIENAYDFDGTNDYVSIPDSASLSVTGDLSISFWINTDVTQNSDDPFIFSKGATAYESHIQAQAGEDYIRFILNDNLIDTPIGSFDYDTWTHYVLSYDADGNYNVYKNGTSIKSDTSFGALTDTASALEFGRRITANLYSKMTLDEVGIWSRALTSTEVTQLYNSGDGISYGAGEITITDLSPANETIFDVDNVDFSANVTTTNLNISNVTLAITGDNTYNTTNTSGTEGVYTFAETGFADGDYNWQVFAYDTDGVQYSSDLYTFSVDTTYPTMVLNYPGALIDYGKLNDTLELNFTVTDDNLDKVHVKYTASVDYNSSLEDLFDDDRETSTTILDNGNYSFTLNGNGAGYLNITRKGSGDECSPNPTYAQAIIPLSADEDEFYINVDDSEGPANYSFYQGGVYKGYTLFGGIGFCPMYPTEIEYYQEIEGAISGTYNLTNITLSDRKNVTIYANDTAGNLNSSTFDWDYKVWENSQTYPTTSLESKEETYSVNITYNSTKYPIASGVLTFNNTNYTSTKTGSGDNAVFTRTVSMPELDTETNFTAFWTINLIEVEDVDAIELESHNVTVSIINFSLCDAVNTVPFWNFTILNESNNAVITSDFQAAFNVSPSGSGAENMFYYEDTSGAKSSFDFCISPGTENYTVNTVIQLNKVGYVVKNYNFQAIELTNDTREDNLYLLSNADSTSFIVEVVSQSGVPYEDVEVRVERFFPGTGTWAVTEILTTDFEGKSVGHLLSEDADYRFKVFENGVSIYNSTSTKIVCETAPCTVTLIIPFTIDPGFEELEDITSTLTFSSTTNIFTYTYEDTSSTFENARLYVYRVFPSNATIYAPCDTTRTAASAIITCDISGSLNGTYRADGYVTRAGEETLVERIDRVLGDDIYNSLGNDGIFWGIFIFIGIVMIGVYRPSAGIIFGIVGVFVIKLMGFVNIGSISVVAIAAIGIILLMRVGRE